MTNSQVVGYPKEHTSFSSLQKITGIFHFSLHTCSVLIPTLWEGECLSLFPWTTWNRDKRYVSKSFPLKGRKDHKTTQYKENQEASQRSKVAFPRMHRISLKCSYQNQTPFEWEKDKRICVLPGLQGKFIKVLFALSRDNLAIHTMKVTRYFCKYLESVYFWNTYI